MNQELRPNENMAYYFHYLSKDKRMGGKVVIPVDSKDWKEEWKMVEYKKYKSNKKIKLLPLQECEIKESFTDILKKRKSSRNFSQTNHNITLREISSVLANSISLKDFNNVNSKRLYPSPGALFPIEIYVYINKSVEIPFGIYHYNFQEHSLELVNDSFTCGMLRIGGESHFRDASATIFMTIVMSRIMQKYEERGYRYALLEAGHIGQNIYLAATGNDLKVCGCGGIIELELERISLIDGQNECGVYAISIG